MAKITDLPTETLHLIFENLPGYQRLESLCVCSQWYGMLRNMYPFLSFDNQPDKFNKAFDFFNQNRDLSAQTQYLWLKNSQVNSFSAFMLPEIFPNVTLFGWTSKTSTYVSLPPKQVYAYQYSKWKKLTFLTAGCEETFPMANCILESGVFDNLTSVQVEFYPDAYKSDDLLKNLIVSVKNVPNLEDLQLKGFLIGLDDSDTLSDNTKPELTLRLDKTTLNRFGEAEFMINDDKLPVLNMMNRQDIPIKTDRSLHYFSLELDNEIKYIWIHLTEIA